MGRINGGNIQSYSKKHINDHSEPFYLVTRTADLGVSFTVYPSWTNVFIRTTSNQNNRIYFDYVPMKDV